MTKISGLIFSADPIAETMEAARHLLRVADEVVIVYSKSYRDYRKLLTQKHDKRIRPFYAVRLGFAEPLRAYGIGLCRYDSIAMLDVDERFNDTARARALLLSNTADIYVLHRHEIFTRNARSSLYTKQYRLFRKRALEWRGFVHDRPIIKGTMHTISMTELHINHYTGKYKWDYNRINDIFPVDLPSYMAARDAYVQHGFGKVSALGAVALFIKSYAQYTHIYAALTYEENRIVKELRKVGLIRYLKLNEPRTIKKLNEEYMHSKTQGIDLLVHLIRKAKAP